MRKATVALAFLGALLMLGVVGAASAVQNAVTPSTNDINRTNGWAHVDQLSQGPGTTDLQFISTRAFYSCFEYRTDGDTSQILSENGGVNYNTLVTDGLYPYTCRNNNSLTLTINADAYVEVRMVFGAETDERFDWTRFNVDPDEGTPEIYVDKTVDAAYYLPGGAITYKYEVTGNDRFVNVGVSDDKCSPVNPVNAGDGYNIGDTLAPKGALNGAAGEKWQFTCQSTTPLDPGAGTKRTNVATVTGVWTGPGAATFTGTDSFTLQAAVLRKGVALYLRFPPDVILAPNTGHVQFGVDVFLNNVDIGDEFVSGNTPLTLWLTPGTWKLQEQTPPPPTGYLAATGRTTFNIGAVPKATGAGMDTTIYNIAPFDLAIEKTGPTYAAGGGPVTYEYEVTNTGTGIVTPVVTDNLCSPVNPVLSGGFNVGDTVAPFGKINAGETWEYTCTYTPDWAATWPFGVLTNTATVSDVEFPEAWTPLFGGDSPTANNTDTFTLRPYIIRKDVIEWGTGDQLIDAKVFTVTIKQGSTTITTVQIKEGDPAELWLVPGTYTFCETVLPFYIPNHECWTQTVGVDYPDWTVVNYRWYGFSHGFYKNYGHRTGWQSLSPPVGAYYIEGRTLEAVFDVPDAFGLDNVTFYNALGFKGGNTLAEKAQILFRQAVAAVLNESRFGSSFGDFTMAELIADVNTALASGDGSAMTDLAGVLALWNNGYVVAP